MRKLSLLFSCVILSLCVGCDLQPKITSLPDTVGEFISSRYPALLADPNAQPEIYNSAASDYGVYASPQLYGSVGTDEYVTYASVNDYIVPPQNDVAGDSALYGAPIAHATTTQTSDNATTGDIADAPTNDYLIVPEYARSVPTVPVSDTEITVARGDTLYSLAQQYASTPQELAHKNNLDMSAPLRIGQKLKLAQSAESPRAATPVAPDQTATKSVAPAVATTTRVQLTEIAVAPGDTLFSLSRRYSVPVNDLAVMNNIAAPFTLSVGQKLKVPNLSSAPVRAAADVATASVATTPAPVTKGAPAGTGHAQVATASAPAATTTAAAAKGTKTARAPATTTKKPESKVATPKQKISSDPSKKLPTIAARSSSKFSWPVRGTILSHYGAKSGGLFNDGINIGASRGTAVKAAENGVVAYAGNEVKGMGNLVIIQHSGGWMTVYAHMDSMSVRRGARVSVGQKIGTVGATGKVDRPQLHFEIRKGTKAYNPASYLRS